jgi:hypothetical protein
MGNFLEKILLPRLNPDTREDQTIKSHLEDAAEGIAREISATMFLTEKNQSNILATKHLVDVFKTLDSDPLKSALKEPQTGDELMDAILHNLEFREKKGDLNAKNLLMFLRNNERDMTAFLDKTALKRALLDYTGQIRDSVAYCTSRRTKRTQSWPS